MSAVGLCRALSRVGLCRALSGSVRLCQQLSDQGSRRRRLSVALNRRFFVAGAAADRRGAPHGPGEQGESQKSPSQSLSPPRHDPLCDVLHAQRERAPTKSGHGCQNTRANA
eukprot:4106215-Prymnesium_polylepis.1